SGAENEAESWAPIQDWLLSHRFANRTVVMIHHEGKSGTQRGTSKREDVCDTIIRLKEHQTDQDDDKEALTCELIFTKAREFYGTDRAPLILRLSTKSGAAEWSYVTVREHTRDRIREMLKQGMPQKQMAKELKLSEGRISQYVKEIRREDAE